MNLSRIVMHVRLRHAQRLEDVRVDEHGEFLAAYALDDCCEQPIGAVVVFELRTWSKVEAARVRQNAHDLSVDVVRVLWPEALKHERVPQPAGVRQQMANRNPVCTLTPVRNVFGHVVIQRQLPAMSQEQDAHRGELLRD
jgi:hypothetical protein